MNGDIEPCLGIDPIKRRFFKRTGTYGDNFTDVKVVEYKDGTKWEGRETFNYLFSKRNYNKNRDAIYIEEDVFNKICELGIEDITLFEKKFHCLLFADTLEAMERVDIEEGKAYLPTDIFSEPAWENSIIEYIPRFNKELITNDHH